MLYCHKFSHVTITMPYLESGFKENDKNCNNYLVFDLKVVKFVPIDWSLKELSFDI